MTVELYDPLTYDNLMAGLALHFSERPKVPLESPGEVAGPGIYALFYAGPFDTYHSISGTESPIYVGKAVPPGSRRGEDVDIERPALRQRLREHARSIAHANNLAVGDFSCRYLAVVPVWITLTERFLVQHHRPLWNACLDGFGDHDPGRGRRGTERSWWDTLHPGRPWANKLQGSRTPTDASAMVADFPVQQDGRKGRVPARDVAGRAKQDGQRMPDCACIASSPPDGAAGPALDHSSASSVSSEKMRI